jgi:hypothetical protein
MNIFKKIIKRTFCDIFEIHYYKLTEIEKDGVGIYTCPICYDRCRDYMKDKKLKGNK